MRIIYDNIIDDVSAGSIVASSEDTNYPVENVQDQRLGKVWKSGSGSTAQSVTFTIDTFPEYPDNATGTSIMYNFNGTTESFIATGGTIDTTTYSGILRLTASTAGSYIAKNTGVSIASGLTVFTKLRSPSALSTTVSILVGASVVSTVTGVGTSFSVFSTIIAGGGGATNLTILGTNTASSGTVFDIDGIYIGTGATDSVIEDLSGNNKYGTTIGIVKERITGANKNGYAIRLDNTYASCFSTIIQSTTNNRTVSYWFKASTLPSGAVGGLPVGTPSGTGRIWVGRTNSSGIWTPNLNLGTGYDVTTVTGKQICDNTWVFLTAVYDRATAPKYYANGELIATGTVFGIFSTVPWINDTFFLKYQYDSTSYKWTSGTVSVGDLRVYDRALSVNEIKCLYNDEPFVGENINLLLRYDLDNDKRINTASILGHNILSGTIVKVQANNSNEWGDPPINEVMSVNSSVILKFLSSTYVYKYWRFYFYGQGGIEIGRLWLGIYETIDPSSLLDFRVFKKNSDTVIYGKHRQKFGMKGESWRRIELSFPNTNEAMIKTISDIYDDVGRWKSFIFCNFDTIRDYVLVEPMYGSFQDQMTFSHYRNQKYKYTIQIEEDL